MRLCDATPGTRVSVVAIDHATWWAYAIRLGIQTGRVVTVVQVLPAGPVIVAVGPTQVAIGRPLAQHIEVRMVTP